MMTTRERSSGVTGPAPDTSTRIQSVVAAIAPRVRPLGLACAVALAWFAVLHAAIASSNASDYRIKGVFVGMREKEMRSLTRWQPAEVESMFARLDTSGRLKWVTMRHDHSVFAAIDRKSGKVAIVVGPELKKDSRSLFMAGDQKYRAELSLLPIQHDDNWVFSLDDLKIAVQFDREAANTASVISRVILAEPSLDVRGGFMDGLTPRPAPSGPGTEIQ